HPAPSTASEEIAAAERFVQLAPDSPHAWYKVGDALFHFGALVGLGDVYPRVAAAFDRSLALDSTYGPTIQHLSEVAAGLGDTAGVRRGLEVLFRIDSTSAIAAARRRHVAAALGDTAGIRNALASDSILTWGPYFIVFYALDQPLDLRGTEEVYPRAHARSATAGERSEVEGLWNRYEVMRGRRSRAPLLSGSAESERLALAVLDGLFADGDSSRAAAAARALEAQLGRPLAAADADQARARFALGQYGLFSSRVDLVSRAIEDLRAARVDTASPWDADVSRGYALFLDAQLARARGTPNSEELLRRVDSALADPFAINWASYGNLIAARLHEKRGELPAALAALRRRFIGTSTHPHYVTYLREEGRLAALLGDRKGAIRAYRHYLALRGQAEPALQPQVRQVRAELEALERESTDR
ncbi:MAG: hypothetical protein H0U66_17630, partial [Gemmatimonadaceae bacterium]|nr:hypothetical protein [Gemmatimonadaceae bacterium]